MAIQAFIHDCARNMLHIPELPLGLRNYLDDVEMYANLVNGSIVSRQIVALALVAYNDRRILDELREEIQKLKNGENK